MISNLDLTEYNSYRVKSIASLALFPESIDDFKDIVAMYSPDSYYVIGKGCNTIFAKEVYSESQPIIVVRDNFAGIKQEENKLDILSGTDLKELSIYAMENSLSGLEYFYDIPGCVGGAITMNAGSCGISFSDYVESITCLDRYKGKIVTLSKLDLQLGYRDSVFKIDNKFFILECTLVLPTGEKNTIMQEMEKIKEKRYAKQPREYPNAGSVFIRPASTTYVGPMIEKLGLKGYRIGGAEISTKHAGFIINADNAKGSDIVDLINLIKTRVYDAFGVSLQTEQRILL